MNSEERAHLKKLLGALELSFNDLPPGENRVRSFLRKQYYRLAKKWHPDTAGSGAYSDRFREARESYRELLELLKEKGEGFLPEAAAEGRDDSFEKYKEASRRYTEALEHYFKRKKSVDLNPADTEYLKLVDSLRSIKSEFAELLQNHSDSVFTGDIIEKIARINVWLSKIEEN